MIASDLIQPSSRSFLNLLQKIPVLPGLGRLGVAEI